MDNIWLDSFRRLIENQQLWLEDEGSANRELLLLSALKDLRRDGSASVSAREKVEDARGDRPGSVLAHTQAYA